MYIYFKEHDFAKVNVVESSNSYSFGTTKEIGKEFSIVSDII